VCDELRVNPAEAEDIREELELHLEELIATYAAAGASRAEATERALRQFGDAARLQGCLDCVHRGDAWWVLRLKGLGIGLLLGALLGVLLPIGGHLEALLPMLPLPAHLDPSRAHFAFNGMLVGGLVGLLAAGGRAILAGWCAGSLVWLAEYVVHWVASVAGGAPEPAVNLLNSVLLAPLLGGAFGAAVGAAVAAILSAARNIRPQIQ
jgi:hypothetical protein